MAHELAAASPSRSIITELAHQYGMDVVAFERTLRATVVPLTATKEEFAAFCLVAKQYGLNPVTREIYAFAKRGGGIQPIVSIDGWANILNSNPAFDGLAFEDRLDDKGNVVSITCRIFRKDRSHPIEATEYLSECLQPTEPWKKWPRRMLRHKSMIQAARYAFGFAGIVDPDEAARFTASPSGPAPQWTAPPERSGPGLAVVGGHDAAEPAISPEEPPGGPGEAVERDPDFGLPDVPDHDPSTGEIGPRALPYTRTDDNSHWRDWAVAFLAQIEQARDLAEVEAWVEKNRAALGELEMAGPKMHARLLAQVGLRKVALAGDA